MQKGPPERAFAFMRAAASALGDRLHVAPDGTGIPIEERNPKEVTHVGTARLTPDGARIRNPAFDVTPAKYVTAIVTERGIASAPYADSLRALVDQR